MTRKFSRSRKDIFVIFSSLILCGVFFVIDLAIPWAIGSILYVPAILLCWRAQRPRYSPIYIAALVTVLTIINLFLQHPPEQSIRIITNHFLAITIIWSIALLGLFYRREYEAKSYLSSIVNSSTDGIIGRTLEGVITSWNLGAETIFGYKPAEIVGKSANILIPEGNRSDEKLIDQIKDGNKIANFETTRKRKDGQVIHVSLTLSPIEDSFGKIIGISSIVQDITRRIEIKNQLRCLNQQIWLEKRKLEEILSIEEHLNTIFNVDRLADFIVEKTSRVLEAEKCSLMFYDEQSRSLYIKAYKGLDGKYIKTSHNIWNPDLISSLVARERKSLLTEDMEKDPGVSKKSRPNYKTKSFCAVPVQLGQKLLGVINVADKTAKEQSVFNDLDLKILSMIVRQVAIALENAKLYREMQYLTITDPLTNINNFRHFSKSLDFEINRMKRFPKNLGLLMIDVNNFKMYNDSFGHLEGDEALKKIGKAIVGNVREIDIACRYAGDEFAVILPGASYQDARVVADKLKRAVYSLALRQRLGLSIGIASFSEGMLKYDLIQKADVALYQAKEENKKGLPNISAKTGSL